MRTVIYCLAIWLVVTLLLPALGLAVAVLSAVGPLAAVVLVVVFTLGVAGGSWRKEDDKEDK